MKRKILTLVLTAAMLAAPATVYADDKDDRIAELESEVEDLQAQIADLQEQLEAATAGQVSTSQDEYNIGDTWTVAGQWSVTLDSVEEVSERNEYADTDPAAVYILTYTYENIGYEDPDGLMNGLAIILDLGSIVDAGGKMGYSYPGDITMYPQETPVGATCEAQVCIGVDNAGDFKIHFTSYDGNNEEQNAVFNVTV